MPRDFEHEEKIVRNSNTTQYLMREHPTYEEWVAVTSFYTIVHIIEKYLSNQHQILSVHLCEPKNHAERSDAMRTLINQGIIPVSYKTKSVMSMYHLLSQASWIARYKCMATFEKQYSHRIHELRDTVQDFIDLLR